MKRLRNRALVAATLAAFVTTTVGCGYLLYPDRRHATPSERLDTRVVVLDCLWFFAGIAPGVVALAVDFTTGAAYYPVSESQPVPGTEVQVHIHGRAPASCRVTLRCVDGEGRDLCPPAHVAAVRGRPLAGPLAIAVPRQAGSATMIVLAVDEIEQVRWSLGERLN